MAKVVPIKEPPIIIDVVEELRDFVEKDMVTEAVVIYRTKGNDETECGRIRRYWFGDNSTIMCIGLCHHMATVIEDYTREQNDILEDDLNP